ncbi:hypothetical protein EVA_15280, partial [gut metagenome]
LPYGSSSVPVSRRGGGTEKNDCAAYAEQGFRILVLAHSESENQGTERPEGLKPMALFMLTDVIRQEAPETLQFF